MISAVRVLGLATACAALLVVDAGFEPASAQDACKGERVTVKSEGRIRGETFATNEAKQRWEKEAELRFGRAFGNWSNAKDRNVECESVKSKRLGLPAVICTATGHPCQRGDQAADGRRDGDRRDRDGDRRDRREYRGPEARNYAREMAHQDYLARMRRKIAEKQERWEKAYRRYAENDYHWRSSYRVRAYAHRAYYRQRDFGWYRSDYNWCDCPSYDYPAYDYGSYYPSYGYYSHFYEMRGRQWRPEERRTGGRAWWKRMDKEGRGGGT